MRPLWALACLQVPSYPYYLANEPVQGQKQLEVTDKYSGQVAYRVSVASSEEIARWAQPQPLPAPFPWLCALLDRQ